MVLAEEGRIITVCEENPAENRDWLIENAWPPLSTTGDRVREAAGRVPPGAWGSSKPAAPKPIPQPAPAPAPVFHPPLEAVPSFRIGQELKSEEIRNTRIRQGDMVVSSVGIMVAVEGEDIEEVRVRKDGTLAEILGAAYVGRDVGDSIIFRLSKFPEKMKDAAVFKFSKERTTKASAYKLQLHDVGCQTAQS
jgi:hypothetical protein